MPRKTNPVNGSREAARDAASRPTPESPLDPTPDARQNRRVFVGRVTPEIDGGRFAIKRTVGEKVVVEADVFADGHDQVSCVLLHRSEDASEWEDVPMTPVGNDRWRAEFRLQEIGRHQYTVQGWIEHFETWRRDLQKRIEAGQDVSVDLRIGAELVEGAAARAREEEPARRLRAWAGKLREKGDLVERSWIALDQDLGRLMAGYPDRGRATTYDHVLAVQVEPARARCGAWYEMFPRSAAREHGRHGTFKDVEARLRYVHRLGFDVLYLPPIHPIGRTHRKGRNNARTAGPGDVGSPWAIGSAEGGHKAVHPELGTLEDFRSLVTRARGLGIEVALDLAFQCSPDHPYVESHPEWFRARPDGTIQFAENPPKKYEDILPFDFESAEWRSLWEELESVVLFWVAQGVKVFRVDNPHTKPFTFWEWLIGSVRREHPETVFLSEAFTRPKVMEALAKVGFTQSYTYFPWRNSKSELTGYFTELTREQPKEFFRGNHWPNTPDILPEYLQGAGRPAFASRLILAATLGASWGIYGPAFELMENRPREHGSEEYLDSEKYEIRHWDLDRADSLADLIARVNRIRRENTALQRDGTLRFHEIGNERLICYSKGAGDGADVIVVVVNLDPDHAQAGWLELPLEELGIAPGRAYQVHDLLSDARFLWQGARNYVELDPRRVPAYVFRLRNRVRTERDFDYYL